MRSQSSSEMQDLLLCVFLSTFFTGSDARLFYGRNVCAIECAAGNISLFENDGYEYSYRYRTVIESSFHTDSLSDQKAQTSIEVTFTIQAVSDCELVLQIQRGIYIDNALPQTTEELEWQEAIVAYPLHFSWQNGIIENICPTINEPVWVLNFKRGILSAMQIRSVESAYAVKVIDVSGKCEADYFVQRDGTTVIRKTKDYTQCENRDKHLFFSWATPYEISSSRQSFIHSMQTCNQTLTNVLQKVTCMEKHVFRPFSTDEGGAQTLITQEIKYLSQHRKTRISRYVLRRTTLVYEAELEIIARNMVESLQGAKELVNGLNADLQTEDYQQVSKQFMSLVIAMRRLDFDSLSEVYSYIIECEHCHSTLREMFDDALPFCGTDGCVEYASAFIMKKEFNKQIARRWLTGFSLIAKPTVVMISSFLEVVESKKIPELSFLAVGSMIRQYCKISEGNCLSNHVIHRGIKSIMHNLGINCHSSSPETNKLILYALRAIGNAGQSTAQSVLQRCIFESQNSMEIRVAAIEAHRCMPCTSDRSALMKVLRNENADSEIRIAAYKGLMQCPTLDLVRQIKDILETEENMQVGSYIWSHLTQVQESQDPLKYILQAALVGQTFKEFSLDPRKYSRYYEGSIFSEKFNSGVTADVSIVWSRKSFIPRSASVNFTVDVFGQAINLLELGGRIQGFESYLQSFLEPKAFKNRQEKKKLQARHKIVNNPLEEAHASWYVRVVGNEVLYGNTEMISRTEDIKSKTLNQNFASKFMSEEGYSYHDDSLLLNTFHSLPTGIGMPLQVTFNGTTSVDINTSGKFSMGFGNAPEYLIKGKFSPRAAITISSHMVVDTHVKRTGIAMESTAYSSISISGFVRLNNEQNFDVELDFPHSKNTLFKMSHKVLRVEGSTIKELKTNERYPYYDYVADCTDEFLGQKLCYAKTLLRDRYSKGAPTNWVFPVDGGLEVSAYMQKTDLSLVKYTLSGTCESTYEEEGDVIPLEMMSELVFDTPGSRVNHKRSIFATYSIPRMEFSVLAEQEEETLKLEGDYKKIDTLHKATIRARQNEDTYTFKANYNKKLDQEGSEWSANMDLELPDKNISAELSLNVNPEKRLKASFVLDNMSPSPIVMKVDLQDKSFDRTENLSYSGEIKMSILPFINTEYMATIYLKPKLDMLVINMNYQNGDGHKESVLLHHKRTSIGEKFKTDWMISHILKSSQFPSLNHKVVVSHRYAKGATSSSIDIGYGAQLTQQNNPYKLELHQEYFDNSNPSKTDVRGLFSIHVPYVKINREFEFEHVHSKEILGSKFKSGCVEYKPMQFTLENSGPNFDLINNLAGDSIISLLPTNFNCKETAYHGELRWTRNETMFDTVEFNHNLDKIILLPRKMGFEIKHGEYMILIHINIDDNKHKIEIRRRQDEDSMQFSISHNLEMFSKYNFPMDSRISYQKSPFAGSITWGPRSISAQFEPEQNLLNVIVSNNDVQEKISVQRITNNQITKIVLRQNLNALSELNLPNAFTVNYQSSPFTISATWTNNELYFQKSVEEIKFRQNIFEQLPQNLKFFWTESNKGIDVTVVLANRRKSFTFNILNEKEKDSNQIRVVMTHEFDRIESKLYIPKSAELQLKMTSVSCDISLTYNFHSIEKQATLYIAMPDSTIKYLNGRRYRFDIAFRSIQEKMYFNTELTSHDNLWNVTLANDFNKDFPLKLPSYINFKIAMNTGAIDLALKLDEKTFNFTYLLERASLKINLSFAHDDPVLVSKSIPQAVSLTFNKGVITGKHFVIGKYSVKDHSSATVSLVKEVKKLSIIFKSERDALKIETELNLMKQRNGVELSAIGRKTGLGEFLPQILEIHSGVYTVDDSDYNLQYRWLYTLKETDSSSQVVLDHKAQLYVTLLQNSLRWELTSNFLLDEPITGEVILEEIYDPLYMKINVKQGSELAYSSILIIKTSYKACEIDYLDEDSNEFNLVIDTDSTKFPILKLLHAVRYFGNVNIPEIIDSNIILDDKIMLSIKMTIGSEKTVLLLKNNYFELTKTSDMRPLLVIKSKYNGSLLQHMLINEFKISELNIDYSTTVDIDFVRPDVKSYISANFRDNINDDSFIASFIQDNQKMYDCGLKIARDGNDIVILQKYFEATANGYKAYLHWKQPYKELGPTLFNTTFDFGLTTSSRMLSSGISVNGEIMLSTKYLWTKLNASSQNTSIGIIAYGGKYESTGHVSVTESQRFGKKISFMHENQMPRLSFLPAFIPTHQRFSLTTVLKDAKMHFTTTYSSNLMRKPVQIEGMYMLHTGRNLVNLLLSFKIDPDENTLADAEVKFNVDKFGGVYMSAKVPLIDQTALVKYLSKTMMVKLRYRVRGQPAGININLKKFLRKLKPILNIFHNKNMLSKINVISDFEQSSSAFSGYISVQVRSKPYTVCLDTGLEDNKLYFNITTKQRLGKLDVLSVMAYSIDQQNVQVQIFTHRKLGRLLTMATVSFHDEIKDKIASATDNLIELLSSLDVAVYGSDRVENLINEYKNVAISYVEAVKVRSIDMVDGTNTWTPGTILVTEQSEGKGLFTLVNIISTQVQKLHEFFNQPLQRIKNDYLLRASSEIITWVLLKLQPLTACLEQFHTAQLLTELIQEGITKTIFEIESNAEVILTSSREPLTKMVELDQNKVVINVPLRIPVNRLVVSPSISDVALWIAQNSLAHQLDVKLKVLYKAIDLYHRYRSIFNMPLEEIIPPFKGHAELAGFRHFRTFDGKRYDFMSGCDSKHILLHDFSDNEFQIAVTYGANPSLIITTYEPSGRQHSVTMRKDYSVTDENGHDISIPMIYADVSVKRTGEFITLKTVYGLVVSCNFVSDLCTIDISPFYFAGVSGMLGTFNNEINDDLTGPNVTKIHRLNDFAKAWMISGSCIRDNVEVQCSNTGSEVCSELFDGQGSVHLFSEFSSCFSVEDAEPYKQMCLRDICSLSPADICTSSAFYARRCALRGVTLPIPRSCKKCVSATGSFFSGGRIQITGADVVFVIEKSDCIRFKMNDYKKFLYKIHTTLKDTIATGNIKYAVVGFGGGYTEPHTIPFNNKIFVQTDRVMTWVDERALISAFLLKNAISTKAETSDVMQALSYASQLSFRAGAARTIILITCDECYAETTIDKRVLQATLQEHGIIIHHLRQKTIKAGRNSIKVYGFNATEIFALNGRNYERSELKVSSYDKCLPLIDMTSGSVWDSNTFSMTSLQYIANQVSNGINSASSHECVCDVSDSGSATSKCVASRDDLSDAADAISKASFLSMISAKFYTLFNFDKLALENGSYGMNIKNLFSVFVTE